MLNDQGVVRGILLSNLHWGLTGTPYQQSSRGRDRVLSASHFSYVPLPVKSI